jgi:hypothetical protein
VTYELTQTYKLIHFNIGANYIDLASQSATQQDANGNEITYSWGGKQKYFARWCSGLNGSKDERHECHQAVSGAIFW